MNQKELIAAMATKMDAPKSVVSNLLEMTTAVLAEQLTDQKSIGILNFGNFEIRKKEERLSVHPSTQIRTLIPPKLAINFKQSSTLKDKLKEIPHHD